MLFLTLNTLQCSGVPDFNPQVLVSLSNTANTRFEVDVQGSTNLKLHVTSNLAVKSPIKVLSVTTEIEERFLCLKHSISS